MCGVAGAGRAGKIAGAAAAAAMADATRRGQPRAAVSERSLAPKRTVPPSQKAHERRRRRSRAGGVSVTCPKRSRACSMHACTECINHLLNAPPRGLSLPTALMLPRCVPSPPRHIRRGMPPQLAAHPEDNQCCASRQQPTAIGEVLLHPQAPRSLRALRGILAREGRTTDTSSARRSDTNATGACKGS